MINYERQFLVSWDEVFYPKGPEMPVEEEARPVRVAQAPVEGAGGAAFGVFPAARTRSRGPTSPAAQMMVPDIAAGAVKGTVTGAVGLPGDIESLIRGVRGIFQRGGDQGKLDAFLSGMEEKTILPTSEEVSKWLDTNVGPVVPPGAPMAKERAGVAAVGQFAGEITSSPAALVKGAAAGGRATKAATKFVAPKVGEMLDDYMRRAGLTPELMAFHGTPARFAPEEGAPMGRFRAEKIGTGEGAQAFGYGLYFAESPDVARGYRNVLADTLAVSGDATTLEKRAGQMALTFGDNTKEGAIRWLSKFEGKGASHTAPALTPELIKSVKAKFEAGTFKQGGSLYTVDIPDEMVSRMIDWDKPLSEQNDAVYNAMRKLYMDKTVSAPTTGPTGAAVLQAQQALGQKGAAEYFRNAGIPGIRYLDQGSRDGGAGTRNIVVFPGEEDKVKILKVE